MKRVVLDTNVTIASLLERQHAEGWGKSVVEHLAHDLHREFPDIAGVSPRNIWRMRSLYIAYTEEIQKLPQPVAEMILQEK